MSEDKYALWSVLELLGHRRLAGFVTEQEIAGRGFLRIEIPSADGSTITQFYSPDSVYGLTPTTEAVARRVAAASSPAPVSRWELAALPEGKPALELGEPDPDDELEDEIEEP